MSAAQIYCVSPPYCSTSSAMTSNDQDHQCSNMLVFAVNANKVPIASKKDLQRALSNPDTMVLDIRSAEEIAKTGYWGTNTAHWANAPGSLEENILLSTAAKGLVHDPKTRVIVYCRGGGRAAKAKEILEAQGYENVMNAGGFPADMEDLL